MLRDRPDEPAAPVGDARARTNAIAKPIADRHDDEAHVLENGVDVAVEVVDDPARAEAVVG